MNVLLLIIKNIKSILVQAKSQLPANSKEEKKMPFCLSRISPLRKLRLFSPFIHYRSHFHLLVRLRNPCTLTPNPWSPNHQQPRHNSQSCTSVSFLAPWKVRNHYSPAAIPPNNAPTPFAPKLTYIRSTNGGNTPASTFLQKLCAANAELEYR